MNLERLVACSKPTGLRALLILACLGLSGTVHANQPSILPKTNSFEGLTVNSSIVGSDGWYAETNLYTAVTNIDISAWSSTNLCGFPVPSASHTNVVRIDTENSSVSNAFGGTSGNTNVVVDNMVLFVASPDEDAQGVITNDSKIQMSYYLNTNGNLVIYHSFLYDWDEFAGPASVSNGFTIISSPVIESGTWARVTVTMDYRSDTLAGWKYYQVALNGVLVTNAEAFVDASDPSQDLPDGSPLGTWFVVANRDSSSAYLGAVCFSGTGYFDDFVVFGDAPPPLTIIASVNDYRGGYIQPSGVIFLLQNESTNFTIVTSNHWQNTLLESNAVSIPITTTVEFNNVTSDHTLYAEFTPFRSTNGTPHWWIAQQNASWTDTNQFDTYLAGDWDGDGLTTFEEWLAGTREYDSGSVLELGMTTYDNTNFTLAWTCGSGYDADLAALPYLVQRSTNLVGGTWNTVHSELRSVGGHAWTDSTPPVGASQVFYRLAVTNSL